MKNSKGITLIALVITIIVLLILAGVTVAMLTGSNGILNQANQAKEAHEEGQAEEKLSLALVELSTDKYTKKEYNENQYIDNELAKKEMIVTGDIVLVDGWQFQIDRSVPKISAKLGQGNIKEQIKLKLTSSISAEWC